MSLNGDLANLIVSDAGRKAGEDMYAADILNPIYTTRAMRKENEAAEKDPGIWTSFQKYLPGGG